VNCGYVDDLVVEMDPSMQTIDVGNTAVFSCLVLGSNDGRPTVSLVWYKDGLPIDDSTSRRRVSIVTSENGRSSTLHVAAVERMDAGMYQCLAASDKDNAQTSSRLLIGGEHVTW